jgi:hypothetical protein
MSDNNPSKNLNKKRLSVELNSMALNIQRVELRHMELEEEKIKLDENIAASNKRILEIQEQLQLMEK